VTDRRLRLPSRYLAGAGPICLASLSQFIAE
jgi:hypothetical protein